MLYRNFASLVIGKDKKVEIEKVEWMISSLNNWFKKEVPKKPIKNFEVKTDLNDYTLKFQIVYEIDLE